MYFWFIAFLLAALTTAADAQWLMQTSNTTASLRGISSLGQGIAWASGSKGTILRTIDDGTHWQVCAVPPDAEKLDFRGVQALDKNAAIVMSSGTGDLSRIYVTGDGCQTWSLFFTNPDKEGFFDSILFDKPSGQAFVLGDPVNGNFTLFICGLKARICSRDSSVSRQAAPKQAAFAASNSLLLINGKHLTFVTGGARSELVTDASRLALPFPLGESSGAFSIAAHNNERVVVGGDYKRLASREQTAAFSLDAGRTFSPATNMPDGYRSAVAYSSQLEQWIAVGPNGTDLSRDGRNWHRLSPKNDDDKDWNALSPPFAVGSHGRIAKLSLKPER